jgi:hypothetical protein
MIDQKLVLVNAIAQNSSIEMNFSESGFPYIFPDATLHAPKAVHL